MAYTIQFNQDYSKSYYQRQKVLAYLQERMAKEGIFRAVLTPYSDSRDRACIKVKPVRLITAKPYCGNHPGECPIGGGKKPKATYLEWEDWVKFHALVNRVLNRFKISADVWSTPADVRGKMWIRKGTNPRVKWDWEEEFRGGIQPLRIWNQGTPDQFKKVA